MTMMITRMVTRATVMSTRLGRGIRSSYLCDAKSLDVSDDSVRMGGGGG